MQSPRRCGRTITPRDHYSQPQKRTFSALTLRHRTVSFDWSKVALRVMIDAATEAGSVFMSVEKVNKHRLPVELEDFCKHAREMGKATRRNEKSSRFHT
jgi:hypothetical protein